jgi:hypothetical protein
MMRGMKNALNAVAVIGLALGGVFGMAGSFVSQRNVQSVMWWIDGVGLIVATTLLAIKYFRQGNDFVAAGFLIFAIGESVMAAGNAAPIGESASSFAAGVALWAAALVLTSVPREFALWTRAVAVIAAILFTATSLEINWGLPVLPTSAPLPSVGYPFLVLTFIGWIAGILRSPKTS